MRTPSGTAALAGGVAMAFALLVVLLLSEAGAPFPPAALGQAAVEALPGAVSVPLIELLQHWAERLLIVAIVAAYLLGGCATAVAAARSRVASGAVVGLGALPWVVTVASAQVLAGKKVDLGADLFACAVGAAAFYAALAFLLAAERVATPATLARRRFLIGAVAAAGIVALGSTALGSTLRAADRVRSVALAIRHLRSKESVPPADPSFASIAHLTPRITSNADHYEVDEEIIKPLVDIATWKLDVGGEVEQPFSLTWNELLDLPAVERPHTLECISNEIGGDLTSTAIWAGVPMADLLARAQPKPSAFAVVLTSVDGYSDSFPIATALDGDTLVAYLMNGVTIPQEHGYPVRALIPNIYGMKNVKWLTRIEVVTYEYQGYWQQRGWSNVATYNTHVRIDVPIAAARPEGGRVTVAGIAFAGNRGISRVQLSTDGGKTWSDAVLESPVGREAWRRWRYDWAAAAGRYRVVARATDGQGEVQTSVQRPPFPNGATGYHAVDVTVAS
ncbi:MAG: molybdopterin-dependent oxidoreductase [Chloroflexi bacterium]|nr:molybdopterin-dependent oxidoreductase [Chloroflexota bacterium]